MLRKRLIFTLLFSNNYFHLSRNFNLQKVGNLDWLKENYNFKNISAYIDELIVLDVSKNNKDIKTLSNNIGDICKDCFVPISIGGGIDNLDKVKILLKAGADKIMLNSAVIDNIRFLKQASQIFGSSNVTVMIQVVKIGKRYFISKSNGRDLVKIDPVTWAKKVEEFGAGEIVITSVNNEGLRKGFDISLTKKIVEKVSIPVIAHGGAGNPKQIYDVIRHTKVSGVGLASMLHYDAIKFLPKVKRFSLFKI